MTKYQLVPYLVHVNVRGDQTETRPLDDLDANGLDLATELLGLLNAHAGKLVKTQTSPTARPTRLRVVSVGKSERAVSLVAAPGLSGVEADLLKADGTGTQKRAFDDIELIPLRHYLLYRPGSHRAVLLAERVGGDGVLTALRMLITKVWASRHADLTININPAGDQKLWDKVLVNRPVVKYQLTRPTTSDARLSVTDQPAEFVLDVKPAARGGRFSMGSARKHAKDNGLSLKEVLLQEVTPVLAPGYEEPAEGAAALFDEGWSVAVQVELESGQKPIVNIESNASVTLTFPIIEGVDEPAARPTDAEVLSAVKRLVASGVFSTAQLSELHAEGLQWVVGPCEYEGTEWKVVWEVVDTTNTDSGSDADGI